MSALARWCARRRFTVTGVWLVLLLALAAGVLGVGSNFTDATNQPDSDSTKAYSLMAQAGMSGAQTGSGSQGESGNIVWHTSDGTVTDAAVQTAVEDMLTKIAALPGVESVASPYDAANTAAASQSSADGQTAYATVTVDDTADTDAITTAAEAIDSSTLSVATGGTAFTAEIGASGGTEGLGIIAALVILLLVFRSVWAAVLPIITGVVGVGASLLALILLSHLVNLSSNTLTMGALIGLGVGIDYALFIVNRYRKALMSGASVRDAVVEAVNTSGRAVLFAGGTVIIALAAVFVVGIDILTGMARGAAFTVLLTIASAITLLPALLSLLGTRVLSRKQRAALAARADQAQPLAEKVGAGAKWAALVQRAPLRLGALAAVLMIVLAVPALSLRLGSADASSDPESSATHSYFELMAGGFGDGYDASLLLVASTPDTASAQAFETLTTQAQDLDGVASVTTTPAADGAQVMVATIIPEGSSQTEETADLVTTLREDTIPAAESGTSLQVYVGGSTASSIDNSDATLSALPLYLALVAGLGFVLLVVAFRSVLVPLIGALGNLLTLAVGLGALTAIFQFGWGSALLGVGSAAPVESLVPVLVIGIMFGLSMDYQVFLVSRMHEEWTHTRDNARAVRVGHSETSRVIATAAAIMLAVFASFGLSGQRIISEIGIGLAVGVLADAFLLRLVLIPAIMHTIGKRNWAYPRWAERITPHLSVEGAPSPTLVAAGGVVDQPGATDGGGVRDDDGTAGARSGEQLDEHPGKHRSEYRGGPVVPRSRDTGDDEQARRGDPFDASRE